MKNSVLTYKDAGVDIEKGDELVQRIKRKVRSTYGERVYAGVGGFACLYKVTPDKFIAAGTDGVGTKLKVAQSLNKHDTIGIDLVAMCVNDILCTGARPLFFMDYLATGKLDLDVSEHIIDGIVDGCIQSEMALIGGETAEIPGMYQDGEYDLAGFAVGEVSVGDLVDGSKVKDGDSIIAIASSGFHSNGYSLLQKLFSSEDVEWLKGLLRPTKIYCDVVKKLLSHDRPLINGMAHITGGGLSNIARVNKHYNYLIDTLPDYDSDDFKAQVGPEVCEVVSRSGLSSEELYKTFNMGMGFIVITDSPKEVQDILISLSEVHWQIGRVEKGEGQVIVKSERGNFSFII